MAGKNIIEAGKDNWQTEVLGSDQPVLVDFWAPWCGPCKALAPTLDLVAEAVAGSAKIAKVNVDDNQELAAQFNIRGIPALLIFKDGKLAEQLMRERSFADIKAKLEAAGAKVELK